MTNIVSYNRLIRPFKNIEAPHTNKKLKHEEDKNFLIQNNDEDDDCELNSTIEATDNNDEDVFFSPVNNPKFHYNKLNENKQKITNKTKIEVDEIAEEIKQSRKQISCLTEIKSLKLFETHADGVIWYFNLLCDTMMFYIKDNKQLSSQEMNVRIHMANAHLLFVKNLYQVRIASSKQLKELISSIHPCIVALSLLNESGALGIWDAHNCAYDNYVYIFSIKIKFCSCKVKYFIILKKPKLSSFDRLNLIESLINCQKLVQDKSIF